MPMVLCDGLVKIYKSSDTEVFALQGLDLHVDRGELMAVIGNSGSGKSTLLNMLGGLDRPSAGKLIVDGKDLFKLDKRQLVAYKRDTVGFVWQNNARNLLPYLTARQNIEAPMFFGNARRKKERALELLELVGLSAKRNSRLSQMSGGEQQRVAIAIALANRPRLLLADEPTGSVDAKTAAYILDVFRTINQSMGLTVVLVTHDRQLSKKVNRVVSICDGKISSERLLKKSFAADPASIDTLMETEEVQDEFAVLDRAGRVQIPADILQEMGISGNKVTMKIKDGSLVISKPETEEDAS